MLEELLKELEFSEKVRNDILVTLKILFQEQNKLIIQNTQEIKKLSQKIEEQQEIISKQQQQIEKLTTSLQALVNILNQELNE